MKLAVLVSQFLQLYLLKRPCQLHLTSLHDTLASDEPKLPFLELYLRRDIAQKTNCVSQVGLLTGASLFVCVCFASLLENLDANYPRHT